MDTRASGAFGKAFGGLELLRRLRGSEIGMSGLKGAHPHRAGAAWRTASAAAERLPNGPPPAQQDSREETHA